MIYPGNVVKLNRKLRCGSTGDTLTVLSVSRWVDGDGFVRAKVHFAGKRGITNAVFNNVSFSEDRDLEVIV